MHRVMYTNAAQYISIKNGVFYYIRIIPHDVRQHYASSRISFSPRTKSLRSAARTASSLIQRLEDYWLGLRLQQMDILLFTRWKQMMWRTTPLFSLMLSRCTSKPKARQTRISSGPQGGMLLTRQRCFRVIVFVTFLNGCVTGMTEV
jgi:hypothetical protein